MHETEETQHKIKAGADTEQACREIDAKTEESHIETEEVRHGSEGRAEDTPHETEEVRHEIGNSRATT